MFTHHLLIDFQTIYTYQATIYPVIILFIIFLSLRFDKQHSVHESRSFIAMLVLTSVLLILDLIMFLAMQGTSPIDIFINKLTNVLSFIAVPLVTFCWVLYVFREIGYNVLKHPWTLVALLIPILIGSGLSIASAFTNLYFFIDANNIYYRGILFPVHIAVPYLYMLLGIIIAIFSRKKLPPNEFIPILLFPLPPTIAGVLQSLFFGTLILFPSMVLSMLLIFIFNQSRQVVTDYLTGLNNRREYDRYIDSIKIKSADKTLAGMLLDLDDFKTINDTYGHFVGDEVLVAIGNLITNAFMTTDFVARTGGDEFFIFFTISDKRKLTTQVQHFLKKLADFNNLKRFPFQVKCSYGVDVFDLNIHRNIRFFIAHIDQIMYNQKRSHHQA